MAEIETRQLRERTDVSHGIGGGWRNPYKAIAMGIGTLPWSDSHGDNYRYFLIMVDLFTLLCEAIADIGPDG